MITPWLERKLQVKFWKFSLGLLILSLRKKARSNFFFGEGKEGAGLAETNGAVTFGIHSPTTQAWTAVHGRGGGRAVQGWVQGSAIWIGRKAPEIGLTIQNKIQPRLWIGQKFANGYHFTRTAFPLLCLLKLPYMPKSGWGRVSVSFFSGVNLQKIVYKF